MRHSLGDGERKDSGRIRSRRGRSEMIGMGERRGGSDTAAHCLAPREISQARQSGRRMLTGRWDSLPSSNNAKRSSLLLLALAHRHSLRFPGPHRRR